MARKSLRPPSGDTILVVDDMEDTLISVRSLLEREGHRVLTAESGDQALALLKEHDIQLLLVDYFMPRMTGEQLVREIRRFDPFVQIILQTGYSGEKPPRLMLADLDIQGYHDKADGPEKLLIWVDAGLKAHRMIQTLRERERLQRELVANVSHEFRTPLNIICGYTELLLDGAFGMLPQTALEPLQELATATSSLADMVYDFLKYARVEAGVLEVTEQPVKTAELAREVERLAGVLAADKNVRFVARLDTAPEELVADGAKLRTILRNLLTNAVKFTAQGEVAFSIAQEAATVRFAVRDTGVGIDAAHLEVIFDPFRQVDGSSTRAHGGIGLGLALSRKLARLLGGDIEVESALGIGSAFTLVLPIAGRDEHATGRYPQDPTGEMTPTPRAAVGF